MPVRTGDFLNVTNLAFLRVCRGLLKKVDLIIEEEDQDRRSALRLVERLIERLEARVYARDR